MPRPLRRILPEEYYFVTNRTFEQRFFLKPSKRINRIIGSCLARAVDTHKIQLYSYVFMANHFHFVLRAPLGNLPEFMACFQSMLARDINRHLGRNGPMFQRRYSAIPILDEGAFMERLSYTLNNPVSAGLVSHLRQYRGLSSYHENIHRRTKRFVWFDRSRWWRAGRPTERTAFEQTIALQTMPLPGSWQSMLSSELRTVAVQANRIRKARRIKSTDRPKCSARSPQPRCHTTIPALRCAFDDVWHRFVQSFRDAARCVALGKWHKAVFPQGSFPPTRYPVRVSTETPLCAVLSL